MPTPKHYRLQQKRSGISFSSTVKPFSPNTFLPLEIAIPDADHARRLERQGEAIPIL
jgi:hypothetical protein